MRVEDAPQLPQHRRMLRMLRSRRVRRRQQPPFEPGIVELLPHGEHALLKRRRIEEFIHRVGGALMPHVFVVGAKGQQELLVVAQERRGVGEALVPQKHQPSAGLQNAANSRRARSRSNQCAAWAAVTKSTLCIGQRGRLRRSRHAGELRKRPPAAALRPGASRRWARRRRRGCHSPAACASRCPCPRRCRQPHAAGPSPHSSLQRSQSFRRISRPVADIVFYAIGETAGSVGSWHRQGNLAGFFNLPESHSNGRIEMLSLPSGSIETPAGCSTLEFLAAKEK